MGVLAFASARAWGLDPSKSIAQYGLDAWNSRNGLPQNSVTALLQSRDGYLWMGTEEGLVRFDGARFTVYSTRETPAFRQNRIEALAEGSDGSLWIGTVAGLLRKRGDVFTAYDTRKALPHEFILALLADADGTLWVGTQKGGLVRWKNERFVSRLTRAEGLPGDTVLSIARSHDGSVWVGTDAGLARVREGSVVSYGMSDGLPSGRVNDILEDRDGTLWIATSGGLARLSGGRITALTKGAAFSNVGALGQDHDGNLWIGTDRGLGRVRQGVVDLSATPRDLTSRVVAISLLEDREGNLWVGTDGDGLLRLRDAPIVSYSMRDGHFSALTARDGLPNDIVSALAQTRDGSLWVGTWGGGLARLRRGHIRVFGPRDGLSSNKIRALLEDRRGALWIGTNGGGLDRIDPGGDTVVSAPEGLAKETVVALCEDPDGALWIGTMTGLWRFQGATLEPFRQRESLADGIRALKADPNGTLWIGTAGGGLVRMRGGRLDTVRAKQGLFDDVTFAILDDDRGNLWMSCNRGIFRVARRELEDFFAGRSKAVTSVAYAEADGMKSAECNGGFQPAGWRGRDGRLWFATIHGVAVLDPAAVRVNAKPPPVLLERVISDGRDLSVVAGQALQPGTRLIELDYSGLSFLRSEQMRFKYRLEGFDTDWVDAGFRRAAFYTNLGPGRYVFRVLASNSDGVWNRVGASFPFSIKPRWTQTRLFAGTVSLTVIAIVLGAYALRVRSLKTRARELEAGIRDAVSNIRILRGLFPICASCKKIRDDRGYWSQIESYIRDHSEAEFSHGICPECMTNLYPDFVDDVALPPAEN